MWEGVPDFIAAARHGLDALDSSEESVGRCRWRFVPVQISLFGRGAAATRKLMPPSDILRLMPSRMSSSSRSGKPDRCAAVADTASGPRIVARGQPVNKAACCQTNGGPLRQQTRHEFAVSGGRLNPHACFRNCLVDPLADCTFNSNVTASDRRIVTPLSTAWRPKIDVVHEGIDLLANDASLPFDLEAGDLKSQRPGE